MTQNYLKKNDFLPASGNPAKNKNAPTSQKLILQIMEVKGYSLKDIAEYTGIPWYTLRRLYLGETRQPNYRVLEKLLALHCRTVKN